MTRCGSGLRAARWMRLVVLVALGCTSAAWAHKASDAYVQLSTTGSGTVLRVDMALRDLDAVLDVDADGDGRLTWNEVKAAWPAIDSYVATTVQLDGCTLGEPQRSLERRSDGVYAALAFNSACAPQIAPAIRYTAFAEVDPTHRAIARIAVAAQPEVVRLLDPRQPATLTAAADAALSYRPEPGTAALAPGSQTASDPPTPGPSAGFVREGAHHIVTGYDHVLFLLCLLFPAVMRRTVRGWEPLASLREALWPVLGIVTAFTVAHSITLALAALKWVSLPPWFIEPAIAVTIVLAALNNMWPLFRSRVAWVTFGFGLLHGFGFASVLGEMDLPLPQFVVALLQFNLGLELGQVAIVLVAVSLMFVARKSLRYVPVVIRGGSTAAIGVALLWFVERTADLKLLPF
jgi:hypothetical protein